MNRQNISLKKSVKYLTKHEVAVLLNVNLSMVNKWGVVGLLNPIRINKRIFFLMSEIEENLIE